MSLLAFLINWMHPCWIKVLISFNFLICHIDVCLSLSYRTQKVTTLRSRKEWMSLIWTCSTASEWIWNRIISWICNTQTVHAGLAVLCSHMLCVSSERGWCCWQQRGIQATLRVWRISAWSLLQKAQRRPQTCSLWRSPNTTRPSRYSVQP